MKQQLDLTGEYWCYLRKSRADLEAEARGEGETLSKHRTALFKLARECRINITEVFTEIVSGESLIHRPEMLRMLDMMPERKPQGVLVMDMDRLGRGNMQEQGFILEAFRKDNIKIVTPSKVYDLNDESDELMTEIQSLFARQELKMITRRMQRGRQQSVEEGNYIGTRPPYGYLIHKQHKERFLVPHPEQAPVVRMIFEWYIEGLGANKVANKLNEMGHKTYSGKSWASSSVLTILKNEVYIGRVQWKKKEQKKSSVPGKRRDSRTRDKSEWIDAKGKHEGLVTEETFKKAAEILRGKYHVPYQLENGITNPLAGLIKCDMCSASMVYRPYTGQQAHLKCYNKECVNKSSRFAFVEEKLIASLHMWLEQYKTEWGKVKRDKKKSTGEFILSTIDALNKELVELDGQKGRLFDFLERGIYDEATFLDRSRNLSDRMDAIKKSLEQAEKELREEKKRSAAQKDVIPKVQNALKLYGKTDDPAKKNNLLKSIIHHATYRKEKHQRNSEFTLVLYPKRLQ